MLGASFFTFTFGNFVTVVAMAILASGAYYRLRGVKNEALEASVKFWREQAEGMTETTRELRSRLVEVEVERDRQRTLKHEALTGLAAERLKTDQTLVIKGMNDLQDAIKQEVVANRDAILAAAKDLNETGNQRFEGFVASQAVINESLQGLLNGVRSLEKKIGNGDR